MGDFDRGVSPRFIAALRKLSEREGWWRDVLLDKSVIIAVRKECLHVYWQGQKIFDIMMKGGTIVAKTHPKYLIDPDLKKSVAFNGRRFSVGLLRTNALIHTYEPGKTLNKLKRAANVFANDEKRGVHNIVTGNNHVVDVEITMPAGDVPDVGKLPRADIAAFERDQRDVRFVVWEAKTFYNKELRARGKDNVVSQINKYKSIVAALSPNIIKSYKIVAQNLVAIADMSLGHRKVSDLVQAVASGDANLIIRAPADVGLIVFGFDRAQRNLVWKPLRETLVKAIGQDRVKARGETKKWKLGVS
jgi:hypothetical protein